MTHATCPFCGAAAAAPVHTRSDGGIVLECRACALLFLRDWPDDLASLYRDDYFEKPACAGGGPPAIGYASYAGLGSADFRWQLALLRLFAPAGGAVLDVGCATGRFLALAARSGFRSTGVEIAPGAVQAARGLGLDVRQGTLAEIALEPCCDAVTAWELLEHVPDLRATLAGLAARLGPGGCLLLSTPDAGAEAVRARGDAWIGYRSSLEHLTYLRREFLERALEQAFGTKPLLVSFTHGGEYATLLGVARTGGLTATDREVGALIASRGMPAGAQGLARSGAELAWIYLHFGALDAAASLIRALEGVESQAELELLDGCLLLARGDIAGAAERLGAAARRGPPGSLAWEWLARTHPPLLLQARRDLEAIRSSASYRLARRLESFARRLGLWRTAG